MLRWVERGGSLVLGGEWPELGWIEKVKHKMVQMVFCCHERVISSVGSFTEVWTRHERWSRPGHDILRGHEKNNVSQVIN